MRGIQADLPSFVSDEEVWQLRLRYLDWYHRAATVLPEDLRRQFEGWYTGDRTDRPIKSFVLDPKRTYVPENRSDPIYASPYALSFLEPLTEQSLILLEAKRRWSQQHPLSAKATGSSQATGDLTVTHAVQASDSAAVSTEERASVRRIAEGSADLGSRSDLHADAEVIPPHNVFIGHGRSALYLKIKEHLKDRLRIDVEFFEAGSRTALHNITVLETMLAGSAVAVIVMTGEDETVDRKRRARQNVVHEVGLFQGKLGFDRVAILVQEGVELFTNIDGLQRIQFADDQIEGAFPKLEQFLERVGLLEPR